MSVPLVIADIGLEVVVVITLLIIGVVSQVIAKLNEVQKAPPRPPARPNPTGDPLADQIAEFLERAQQRRKVSRPPPPQTARPLRPVNSGSERVQTLAVENADPQASVADHVSSYMSELKRGPVGSELGKEVSQSDQQLEQRLHSVFDHRLGSLSGSPGETAETPRVDESAAAEDRVEPPPRDAPAGLVTLLANPTGMRQAILVSEIFQRPEQRWS